jgi:hypothetical protein
MPTPYEETKAPRFVMETVNGIRQIRLRAQPKPFVMLFIAAWLIFWTFAGISTIGQLASHFQWFLVLWLAGWALGWTFAALTLTWMLAGSEVLRVVGSDLEIGYEAFGIGRRRLFRGSDIRNLAAGANPNLDRYNRMPLPFFPGNKSGCLKFNYGARTIYAGSDRDEAEGQLILDLLRKQLPATASKPA